MRGGTGVAQRLRELVRRPARRGPAPRLTRWC